MRYFILGTLLMALFLTSVPVQGDDPRDLPYDVETNLEQDPQYEWTSLHWAARRNRIEEVEEHLRRGRHAEARDFQGRTPLHIAVLSGHDDVVALFIQHGADVNARDQWGITPLGRAELVAEIRGWDRDHIAGLLREAGGDPEQCADTLLAYRAAFNAQR